MVMSSIMRRRSGLTASLLMGGSCPRRAGPMIFGQATPGRSPHLQDGSPLPRERFSPMTQSGHPHAERAAFRLVVWTRDVLGAGNDLKGLGQAAGIEWRVVTAVGAGGRRAQALTHEHFG